MTETMNKMTAYVPFSEEKPNIPWEDAMRAKWPVHPWMHPGELVPKLLSGITFSTMLDVGGGNGIVAHPFYNEMGCSVHILDAWYDYVDDGVKRTKPGNLTIGNALDADKIFGEQSFDVVQATEIIEHMPKVDGVKMVEVLKRVARKVLILSTPHGFLNQPAIHGNPFQVHVCGWVAQEFEALGIEIYFNASQMFGVWKRT